MGLFTFLHAPDINSGVKKYESTDNAILLDVRTTEEYRKGHIEGSINIPLDKLMTITNTIKAKNTPLYVYCLSGGRSAQAVSYLKQIGYSNTTNIGGISGYRGKVAK